MVLYEESAAAETGHFAYAFNCESVVYGCDDVMAFETLQSKPFCLEKFSVRKVIFLCFNSVFSVKLVGIR